MAKAMIATIILVVSLPFMMVSKVMETVKRVINGERFVDELDEYIQQEREEGF
jgi:hypothetical protein